jgi:hypothetical protein
VIKNKLTWAFSLVSATAFFIGCQDAHHNNSASMARPGEQVVMCDSCKTTWVRSQKLDDKGHPIPFAYTVKGAHVCDDCEKAVAGYYATSKLEPCKTCGDKLQIVTPR